MSGPVLKSRVWARPNDRWASDEVRWRYREFELLEVPAPPVTAHGIAGTSHNCYHVEGAMALWLHLKPTGTWLKGREKARIDLTGSPSPTVNAHGMYGLGIHQFDLEYDDMAEAQTKTDKPPYRIPLMGEIAKVRGTNGLKVVSTFSGAGGSCLGFEMAGYNVIWASEFVEAAREVHELNFPHCHVDPNDIRVVEPEEILDDIHMDRGEIDLLNGSPPCASFSQAGRREKTWGKTKTYCVAPWTPVLLTDLTWKPAGDLQLGEEVVAFEEANKQGRRGRRFRPATVTAAERLRLPCREVTMEDGTTVTCSTEHRWLVVSGSNLRWKQTKSLQPGDQLLSVGQWGEDPSRDAGWLAGMFDGEGSVSRARRGNCRPLMISQKPGVVLDKMKELLAGWGFQTYEQLDARGTVKMTINGGLREKLRLLGTLRPVRLLSKAELVWDGVNVGCAEKVTVASVEDVGEQDVVGLGTSEHTFIAAGLFSHNSDTKQRSDDLFFEFARLVDGLQPRTFVAENVPGLGRGKAKGYLKMIAARLRECGYKVAVRELDAQWLGVPQARKRLIFVGVRKDLPFDPVYPRPLPYRYTVADACPWIVRFRADQHGSWEPPDFAGDERPAPTVATTPHSAGYYHHTIEREDFYPDDLEPEDADTSEKGGQLDPEEEGCDISRFAIGEERHNVKPGGKSAKYLNLVKAHPDKPSPTVTQTDGCSSAASVVCPDRPRKSTIPELKRICGFPDDFVLTGSYRQRWERLGRAVPPPLMCAVAKEIAEHILLPCKARGL